MIDFLENEYEIIKDRPVSKLEIERLQKDGYLDHLHNFKENLKNCQSDKEFKGAEEQFIENIYHYEKYELDTNHILSGLNSIRSSQSFTYGL